MNRLFYFLGLSNNVEPQKFHKYIRAKTAGSKLMYTFSGITGAQKKTPWINCPLHKDWDLSSAYMKSVEHGSACNASAVEPETGRSCSSLASWQKTIPCSVGDPVSTVRWKATEERYSKVTSGLYMFTHRHKYKNRMAFVYSCFLNNRFWLIGWIWFFFFQNM